MIQDSRVGHWVSEVLALQEAGKMPPASQKTMPMQAAFGLAAAALEETQEWAIPD